MPAVPKIILYVEDEEADRFFMERAFAKLNMADSLKMVCDGQAAIDYLEGRCIYQDRDHFPFPALVLLDLNLPMVSGFEVLKWIRQRPACATLPVAVFSSSWRGEDRAVAHGLGANEYFEKPKSGMFFPLIVAGLRDRWL